MKRRRTRGRLAGQRLVRDLDDANAVRRQKRLAAAPTVAQPCGVDAPLSQQLCWYPVGHATPHAWETLRPDETWDARDREAGV